MPTLLTFLEEIMSDIAQNFIDESRDFLSAKYLWKVGKCLEELNDEDIWWRAGEESNSIGNLILHIEGNIRQWIIGGVGSLPYERERQQEFDERRVIPREELLESLRETVKTADAVLSGLDLDTLTERRDIQGRNVTVLRAIYHVIEHFSMHTGQIIMLTKMRAKKDLHLFN